MEIAPINHIEIHNGRAVVGGVKVANIAALYVHLGTSISWIVENYDLSPAQIHAALSYYYDHREEIEREIKAGDDLAKQTGLPSKDVLAQMRDRAK